MEVVNGGARGPPGGPDDANAGIVVVATPRGIWPYSLELPADTEARLRSLYAQAQPGVPFDTMLARLASPPSSTSIRYRRAAWTGDASAQAADELDRLAAEVDSNCTSSAGTAGAQPHPLLDDVLMLPCNGPLAIVPAPKRVVVGVLCGMAVLRGADVFAPGVKGIESAVEAGEHVSIYADIDGGCVRGCAARFDGRVAYVGNGVLLTSRKAFFREAKPTGVAVAVTEPLHSTVRFPAGGLPADRFVLQNVPSCVAGHELGVQSGDTVLDMCAAPGGKTVHIANLMGRTGRLVALERSANRADRLRTRIEDGGLAGVVEVHKMDACKALRPSAPLPRGQNAPKHPQFAAGSFDRILLDAPCTGLGQRPRLQQAVPLANLESMPRLQRKLFATAVALLRPGGTLVYSTCTISPLENEAVIGWALEQHPNLVLLPPSHPVGGPGLPGLGLSTDQLRNVQRFDPRDPADTIGFFCARLRKKSAVQ